MSTLCELERLKTRLSRIQLIKKPPTLRMAYLKHDDQMPADLHEWILGIRIEERNLTRVE